MTKRYLGLKVTETGSQNVNVCVIGVEPSGAAKMTASLAAGHPVTLDRTAAGDCSGESGSGCCRGSRSDERSPLLPVLSAVSVTLGRSPDRGGGGGGGSARAFKVSGVDRWL